MKELWLEVLEWIQLGVTLVFMVFMLGVLGLVVRYHRLEFNGLWKTRAAMAWIAFMWGLSLLLGRHHLWATERISFIENNSTIIENNNSTISNNQSTLSDYSNNNGMVYYNASHYRIVEEGGAIGTSESNVEGLCRAHVFLTYGIFMPAFFLIILVILREKERTKLQLYSIDPNLHVLVRVLPWVVPPLICHIVILALSGVSSSGSSVVWATYRSDHRHCVVPVLSTAPFAVFYSFFLFFYWGTSRRLFTRLINRTIRMRVWTTQLFFFAVFPLEIVLRFISIFISKYNDAFESVYHTYYFLQLIICTIAIVELVLLPVLDAIRFPLMAGVTATACQEYHKSEEERKKRRYTRSHAALQRVMSEDEMEKGNVKNNNNNNNNNVKNNNNNNNNNNNVKNNNSNMISSSSSSSSPNKGNKIEMEPLQKKSSTTSLSPSSNKPLLVSSGSNDSIDDDHDLHDSRPSSAVNTFSNLANLTLTTTKAGDFPEALDVDDVFANMDDEVDAVEDSSLKLKVDGIFLPDPELQ